MAIDFEKAMVLKAGQEINLFGEKAVFAGIAVIEDGRAAIVKFTVGKETRYARIKIPWGKEKFAAVYELVMQAAKGVPFDNKTLREAVESDTGKSMSGDGMTMKDGFNILEAVINSIIAGWRIDADKPDFSTWEILADSLPAQTYRDGEQEQLDQFSTPIVLAAKMAWLADIGKKRKQAVLDPSAGTGNLVAAALSAAQEQISLFFNEISERRYKLLADWINAAPNGQSYLPYNVSALDLYALSEGVKVERVLMNPPFSDIEKHIAAAMKMLDYGGRMIALLPEQFSPDTGTNTARDFWRKAGGVNFCLDLDGSIYRKFGTTYGCTLVSFGAKSPRDDAAAGMFEGQLRDGRRGRKAQVVMKRIENRFAFEVCKGDEVVFVGSTARLPSGTLGRGKLIGASEHGFDVEFRGGIVRDVLPSRLFLADLSKLSDGDEVVCFSEAKPDEANSNDLRILIKFIKLSPDGKEAFIESQKTGARYWLPAERVAYQPKMPDIFPTGSAVVSSGHGTGKVKGFDNKTCLYSVRFDGVTELLGHGDLKLSSGCAGDEAAGKVELYYGINPFQHEFFQSEGSPSFLLLRCFGEKTWTAMKDYSVIFEDEKRTRSLSSEDVYTLTEKIWRKFGVILHPNRDRHWSMKKHGTFEDGPLVFGEEFHLYQGVDGGGLFWKSEDRQLLISRFTTPDGFVWRFYWTDKGAVDIKPKDIDYAANIVLGKSGIEILLSHSRHWEDGVLKDGPLKIKFKTEDSAPVDTVPKRSEESNADGGPKNAGSSHSPGMTKESEGAAIKNPYCAEVMQGQRVVLVWVLHDSFYTDAYRANGEDEPIFGTVSGFDDANRAFCIITDKFGVVKANPLQFGIVTDKLREGDTAYIIDPASNFFMMRFEVRGIEDGTVCLYNKRLSMNNVYVDWRHVCHLPRRPPPHPRTAMIIEKPGDEHHGTRVVANIGSAGLFYKVIRADGKGGDCFGKPYCHGELVPEGNPGSVIPKRSEESMIEGWPKNADSSHSPGMTSGAGGNAGHRQKIKNQTSNFKPQPPPQKNKQKEEIKEGIFEEWKPSFTFKGQQPHPAPLVMTASLAAVELPEITAIPNLPRKAITGKKFVSDAQLENIALAKQAHEKKFRNSKGEEARLGFMTGDGTGTGKGIECAGVIMDNFREGRRKAVWVSKNFSLFKDAKRDSDHIGFDTDMLFRQKHPIPPDREGVCFTSYFTLAKDTKDKTKSRVDELVEWLGEDFDGPIVFDECHMMRSAATVKGARGNKGPSQMATAGTDLQNRLPNARIFYASATAASEAYNMAYAGRLGLWGENAPFANLEHFRASIARGGMAAMELVCREMKASGVYNARTLSFDGVTYETLTHNLTDEQVRIYDALCGAWHQIIAGADYAMKETLAESNGQAKSKAMSALYGSSMRFFQSVVISMQMPSVISRIRKSLDEGHAPVIQLVSTGEATLKRRLEKAADEDVPIEDVTVNAVDILMEYLEKNFPTFQFQSYIDENGNERTRLLKDEDGNPVHNPDALAKRDEILAEVGSLKIPEGPLEQLFEAFGHENIAENTGRSRRLVTVNGKRAIQSRSAVICDREVQEFLDDKRRILVFSEAGGTGKSYHASREYINQRKRDMFVVQGGFRADSAMQFLGRVHRTNQAWPPHYILAMTNLPGHARFVVSLARRMSQLGALTMGSREAAGGGLFSEEMNFDNRYGQMAASRVIEDVFHGNEVFVEAGMDRRTFMAMTGLKLEKEDKDTGETVFNDDLEVPVTKLLNRLLMVPVHLQPVLFGEFFANMAFYIDYAKRKGQYDFGLQTVKAEKAVLAAEYRRDDISLNLFELEVKVTPVMFGEARYRHDFLCLMEQDGEVSAIMSSRQITKPDGAVCDTVRQVFPDRRSLVHDVEGGALVTEAMLKFIREFSGRAAEGETLLLRMKSSGFVKDSVSDEDAEKVWSEAADSIDKVKKKDVWIVTGRVLKVWEDFSDEEARTKAVRIQDTETMERYIGIEVPKSKLKEAKKRFGAETPVPSYTPEQWVEQVMRNGAKLTLSKGWEVRKRKIAGDFHLAVLNVDAIFHQMMRNIGASSHIINFKTVFSIPLERAAQVVARLLAAAEVVEVDL